MKWFSQKWSQSYTHRIVTILIFNSVAWVWCSYYLAYIGKEEIAESLSEKVVINLIAVFLGYAVKALFENISKNTDWPAQNTTEAQREEKY
ncbi:hypothetical protein Sgly_0364 [Syntrophobotulus glycolicus DSM 8271]|uniref:Uncharacterized protein n=1 Tax=Syntrophobotulus glycolicus (strain DSM 8271 / FlGlyR) TaxID=645991 RepID=F0SXI4_SYNGF|nr:hypothetical protein [Syntrophobotulus glycolicus]ADY54730.1 hypothetical protein Sgly_0364 [Syntrophobotulus glycolicus DSM 8271]